MREPVNVKKCCIPTHLFFQFKWSRELRARFDESQETLGRLQTRCVDSALGNDLKEWFQVIMTIPCLRHNPDHSISDQIAYASSEGLYQPERHRRLIRVFAIWLKTFWVIGYPLCALWRLSKLRGCAGWSEFSQGSHAFFLENAVPRLKLVFTKNLRIPFLLTVLVLKFEYSRLSLSRTRLSRITAYLEMKIWSLFKHRELPEGNKILWKRGEIAPWEQFLLFSTIFSIYLLT